MRKKTTKLEASKNVSIKTDGLIVFFSTTTGPLVSNCSRQNLVADGVVEPIEDVWMMAVESDYR